MRLDGGRRGKGVRCLTRKDGLLFEIGSHASVRGALQFCTRRLCRALALEKNNLWPSLFEQSTHSHYLFASGASAFLFFECEWAVRVRVLVGLVLVLVPTDAHDKQQLALFGPARGAVSTLRCRRVNCQGRRWRE